MENTTMKRIAAGTVMAGALSLAAVGFGGGLANAKPHHGNNPPGPAANHNGNGQHGNGHNGNANRNRLGNRVDVADTDTDTDTGDENGTEDRPTNWVPGMAPGLSPLGAPGQVMKLPTIGGVTNPFFGVPPGHWGDVNIDIPQTWQPDVPGVTEPLPLQFNAELGQWGVTVNGQFVAYPIPLPAPQG